MSKKTIIKNILITSFVFIIQLSSYVFLQSYYLPQEQASMAVSQVNEDGSREMLRSQDLMIEWLSVLFTVGFIIIYLWIWKELLFSKIKNNLVIGDEE